MIGYFRPVCHRRCISASLWTAAVCVHFLQPDNRICTSLIQWRVVRTQQTAQGLGCSRTRTGKSVRPPFDQQKCIVTRKPIQHRRIGKTALIYNQLHVICINYICSSVSVGSFASFSSYSVPRIAQPVFVFCCLLSSDGEVEK